MMKKKIILSFLILSFFFSVKGETLDSLIALSENETNDSVLVDLFNSIGSASNSEDGGVSKEYWSKALALSKKYLSIKETTYYLEQLSTANNGLGIVSKQEGNLTEAISYYQKSLKINTELDNKKKMSANYFNIGVLYRNLKEYETCLDYYKKSLDIRKELNDSSEIVRSYLSIGIVYRRMNQHEKALEYYHKSLDLSKKLNDKEMETHSYSNIAVIHNANENFEEAILFFNKGFEYTKTQNNKSNFAKYYYNVTSSYAGLGNYSKAIEVGEKSHQLYTEMGRISNISSISHKLSNLYFKKNNHKKALQFFKEYILLRDSVYNEKTTKEVTQKEMQFEFDKQNLSDSLARAETEKIIALEHQQEIKQQKLLMYAGGIILLLVIIFSIVVFNRLKISNKQKKTIEKQKLIVEIKNREITDSINYAKRIQSAILPALDKIKESLPNSFVFYRPKDIVAGDFYWHKKINNKIFIAVADCTGHGVPGAMVSVVCNNALNRAVNDFWLLDPAKILDKTAELVIEAFKENAEEDVKDGMDIALCSFDLENNKLEYAGAMNSIFHIKNNELIEIKGDKQPIGQFANIKAFTLNKINLTKGDKIYMFSDGYADQFGGEKGKKFMYKRFRDLMLGISNKEFTQQKSALETEFDAWRKDIEQLDDVCVVGIQI